MDTPVTPNFGGGQPLTDYPTILRLIGAKRQPVTIGTWPAYVLAVTLIFEWPSSLDAIKPRDRQRPETQSVYAKSEPFEPFA